MSITKTYIEPCCANQKPNLNPPKRISFKASLNKIPAPKETTNQIDSNITKYLRFSFQ